MFDSSKGGARVIRALDLVTHRHTFQILFRQIQLRRKFYNRNDIYSVFFSLFLGYYERYFVSLKIVVSKDEHEISYYVKFHEL